VGSFGHPNPTSEQSGVERVHFGPNLRPWFGLRPLLLERLEANRALS